MGECYITRRGTKVGEATEQLGVYPTGNDGRPIGNVTVLDNVINLSSHLFQNNSNVLTAILPNNLRQIDDGAFQKCTSLQKISIPDKIANIPNYCFDGCSNLSEIDFSKGLNEIGEYAFQNCTKLSIIKNLDSISSLKIKSYAFSNCDLLDNETINKLTQKVKGLLYSYAFANLTGVTEITSGFAYDYYFSNCINLRKLTILNALSDGGFGEYIVNNCSSLQEVVLPNNATKLNDKMFKGRDSLKIVNIPKSTITIGSYALSETSISIAEIPKTVTTIDSYAFYKCSKLSDVIVEDGAEYELNQYAFANCPVLTNESVYNIMEHYSTVYSYIFSQCEGLTNIKVSRFWTSMFNKCINLVSARSLKGASTGDDVFLGCTKLQEAYIAEGTVSIGASIFYNCASLKTVYLPSSLTTTTNNCLTSTSSSYYIFYGCTSLEDVQLGEDWNLSIRLNVSNNLTVDSMVAMFESLKDLTGTTAKTLTLGSTNLGKLTDEQKSIATNKNWTLA